VPRYVVERIFRDGLEVPGGPAGVEFCRGVVGVNEDLGVTWVHSYVSEDRTRSYCVYDGPGPESIRRAAERNWLPVDRITRVSILDPYFYTPTPAASPDVAGVSRGGSVEASRPRRSDDR
jgi:uncharacterized protein DUF4242